MEDLTKDLFECRRVIGMVRRTLLRSRSLIGRLSGRRGHKLKIMAEIDQAQSIMDIALRELDKRSAASYESPARND